MRALPVHTQPQVQEDHSLQTGDINHITTKQLSLSKDELWQLFHNICSHRSLYGKDLISILLASSTCFIVQLYTTKSHNNQLIVQHTIRVLYMTSNLFSSSILLMFIIYTTISLSTASCLFHLLICRVVSLVLCKVTL